VERAERDVAAVRPQAAECAVGARPQAAERAAALRQEEAAAEHAVGLRPAAEHAVAQPREEAASVAAAVLQQVVAEGARVALGRPAVLPSAAAWAFHPDQPPPWLAPRPAERSARAMEQQPVAAR
jgi:hypothetical protein